MVDQSNSPRHRLGDGGDSVERQVSATNGRVQADGTRGRSCHRKPDFRGHGRRGDASFCIHERALDVSGHSSTSAVSNDPLANGPSEGA
jgi:hypothetical protein